MPQEELGMVEISSSQLAMQHLSPCKKRSSGGRTAGRDCFYMAEIEGNHCLLPRLDVTRLRPSALFVLMWPKHPEDSASDWSHMKTHFMTYYDQFYSDLSKQAPPPSSSSITGKH